MPANIRLRRVAVLPLLLAFVLVASLFAVAPDANAAPSRPQRVYNAMTIVKNQVGDPYQYGAAGPNRFDCSGLFYYSFRKAGFMRIPRTSDGQARFANRIKRRNMRKGDFVFFHNYGNVYHVAMFVGWRNGRRVIVHAPYGNQRVKYERIWTNSWFPGTLRFR